MIQRRFHEVPMKRTARCTIITILGLVSVCGTSVAKPVTVDDLMALRSIVDVKISPDGERVAYVVSTPSLPRNEHDAALFVVRASGGTPLRIGETLRILNTPLPAPRLRWSPDGATISVLAFAGERPQVFGVPAAGGAPRALTTAPEGVSGFEWSPDGGTLAYLTRDPMSAEEARQRQDKSFVIHVDAPDRPTRIGVQPIGGGAPRLLTPPAQYVESFTWSPDGREIAYAAAPVTGFMAQYSTRLYAVSAAGGAPRTIVDRPGMNSFPQYSPDGTLIAFVSSNSKVSIMAPRGLNVVPAGGGGATLIRAFGLGDAWVSDLTWARDSTSVYLLASDGTYGSGVHMFDQPIVRVWVDNGRTEAVVAGRTANYSLSLSRNGVRLAYRSVEARTMGDVSVLDTTNGRHVTLTDVNPELRSLALGELKPIRWRSFDGMEVWGLLLTPPNVSRKVPTIVYCHGGPGGGITWGLFPQFMHVVSQVDPYPVEALASAGFAVFMPMPRGGAGYGEKGQRSIVKAWGEADYQDIMTGVDQLVRDGIADPDRLGVMGASYGGYMTDWIVTQTGRFKAASTAASISDLNDLYYLSDGPDVMVEYFGKPWEARELYAAHSAINFADKVTTPLLIQHGERDNRVPIASATRYYRALKALGKTVEFDIYPRASHLAYEPAIQREVMKRNFEWFTRWIKPTS
uniref:Peptidase S9 prolyl oligopeptidase n=1 Tax=uncultured bacterium 59 TaxID=698390 RepID=E3T6H1_9BACT|nr:peptidase S9 prolyl oligopeptidase [uncultured bacterium 59]